MECKNTLTVKNHISKAKKVNMNDCSKPFKTNKKIRNKRILISNCGQESLNDTKKLTLKALKIENIDRICNL